MITTSRTSIAIILLLTAALAVAACAPSAGPLGTPATPAVTPGQSDVPAPSDVAPESMSPSATTTPTTSPVPTSSTAPSTTAKPSPTPKPTAAATTIVRAYFLGSYTGFEGLVPVLRTVPETAAVARAAVDALLGGPNATELAGHPAMYSAIPDGTRLLDVRIADRIATVNFSGEFAIGGGSASVLGRLAQVVYTLTQFSTVDSVNFELDGQPVETFSSEGVILDHPARRPDFRDFLPAIFVDRPAWGAAAGNPIQLSGIANVFEATFQAQVLNGAGKILADQQVMASCGTGCWGTFKTDVPYTIAKAQYGTLRVFEPSAKDGKPTNVTDYRVWLTP